MKSLNASEKAALISFEENARCLLLPVNVH